MYWKTQTHHNTAQDIFHVLFRRYMTFEYPRHIFYFCTGCQILSIVSDILQYHLRQKIQFCTNVRVESKCQMKMKQP